MFAGLGTDLPHPTQVLINHANWIYPVSFGGIVAILIAKEVVMRDKRLSTMLTFLIAMGAQFLGHWMTTVYYLPLFDLIRKLS